MNVRDDDFVWSTATRFSEQDPQQYLALMMLFLALGKAGPIGKPLLDPIAVEGALNDWAELAELRAKQVEQTTRDLVSRVRRAVYRKLGPQPHDQGAGDRAKGKDRDPSQDPGR